MRTKNQVSSTDIFNSSFFRYYFITMRPYLLFVSAITGMAGLSFAPDLPIENTSILFIAFFLSYGFGQAMTDCSQIDTDSISSPYRPLTRGLLNKKDVYLVSLTGLFVVGFVFIWHSLTNLILTLFAIMGLATYTYFKKRWWAGPFYNAWIVLALFMIGFYSGSGGSGTLWQTDLPFILSMIIVFFGYANFVLIGYFKDISADRKTGYQTMPVVFGLKTSALVSDLFALLTLTAVILMLSSRENVLIFTIKDLPILSFLMPGIFVTLVAQYFTHKVQSEELAHRAIVPILHAYILLLSSVIVYQKPSWTIFLIIFYAAFILIMRIRPRKEQI